MNCSGGTPYTRLNTREKWNASAKRSSAATCFTNIPPSSKSSAARFIFKRIRNW